MARDNMRERATDRSLWRKLLPLLIPLATGAMALAGSYYGMKFSLADHDRRLSLLESSDRLQTQGLSQLTAIIAGIQARQEANRNDNVRQDSDIKELRGRR